jgi:hypothetical protein
LWFVAHVLSPVGYEISLWRGIGAVFLITVFGSLSSAFVKPAIGDWNMLVELAVDVLIVRSVLRLPLGRSVIAVIIYWVVLVTAVYFLFIRPGKRPNQSVERTGMSRSAQCRLQRQWRLIPVAHLGRSAI